MPPRGSAQDKILEEIHQRDRAERFALATLFAKMLGGALGVRGDLVDAMLTTYKHELSQVSYTPEYAKWQRRRKTVEVVQQVKKKLDDNALLKKLEGFTAPEEKAPTKKTGARRR